MQLGISGCQRLSPRTCDSYLNQLPALSAAAEIIKNGRIEGCKAQESGLALLWTLGIFALNIGPVPMGFVLDLAGPRYTSIAGAVLERAASLTHTHAKVCSLTRAMDARGRCAIIAEMLTAPLPGPYARAW